MENTTTTLIDHYDDIVTKLQIPKPPRIRWAKKKEMGQFSGLYVPDAKEIRIRDDHQQEPIENIFPTLVHELAHHLMFSSGYRTSGHGWQFLAAYALLLNRLGTDDILVIEHCMIRNWPKWPRWHTWYKHLVKAQEVYRKVVDYPDFQSYSAMQIADAVLAEGRKTHPILRPFYSFLLNRYHSIIGDIRGHWFAFRLLAIVCFICAYGSGVLGFPQGVIFLAEAGVISISIFAMGIRYDAFFKAN